MKRAFIVVLDSFGIGSTSDAHKFNDVGSNTFGNIVKWCYLGKANNGRIGPLYIPNLVSMGLVHAAKKSIGKNVFGIKESQEILGSYAYASEISSGKDTSSGHWEIAGVPVLYDWDYFSDVYNSFPKHLLDKIVSECNLSGVLGNCHSSGVSILDEFGEEHINTKKPIFYTSIDSVFQVACHENVFGLEKLYVLCNTIRKILDNEKVNIARVIARPFIGNKKFNFHRTGNRRDFSVKPHDVTVMKKLVDEQRGTVISIGKISDIYSGEGITRQVYAKGLSDLFNSTLLEVKMSRHNTIVFVNFVDFDSSWGHRRDVSGYAKGLEWFDRRLPELLQLIEKDDILIITADHGCDPTWIGSDHTRENIPILVYWPTITPKFLGHRDTFADIAQTLAKYFNLSPMKFGKEMFLKL
ncbi:phosphopentomutase [Buchnera aphidicola]|uniref:Phosphopentomutase n=1 Tax=Buchnera aphidicola subsp. Melaphis rhois TaxID=118103 RepID=A0A4D6YBZ0_BUCMH|nr:phosphopentomutase [Buchnera aphidicola]QCI23494.1 phosphopentomutase [Buchnera aphidicola (Melaphis rhois)]